MPDTVNLQTQKVSKVPPFDGIPHVLSTSYHFLYSAHDGPISGKQHFLKIGLTHCGLVTPYGNSNLGKHWFT